MVQISHHERCLDVYDGHRYVVISYVEEGVLTSCLRWYNMITSHRYGDGAWYGFANPILADVCSEHKLDRLSYVYFISAVGISYFIPWGRLSFVLFSYSTAHSIGRFLPTALFPASSLKTLIVVRFSDPRHFLWKMPNFCVGIRRQKKSGDIKKEAYHS